LLAPDIVSGWFLGSAPLATPLGLVTLGQLLHGCAYASFRGLMRFGLANLLQVINVGVLPVGALLAFADVSTALAMWGAISFILSLGALAAALVRAGPATAGELGTAVPALVTFGLPRVLTDAAVGFVNALPVVLIAGVDVATAGAFGAAQSVLVAGGALLGIAGVAWLPRAAAMLSASRQTELGARVQLAGSAALRASTLVALAILAAPRVPYEWWLGAAVGDAAHAVLVVASWSLPGLVLYSILRSPLDASSTLPYSGIAMASGAGASLVTALLLSPTQLAPLLVGAIVFGAGWVTAGAVIVGMTSRILPSKARRTPLREGLALCAAATGAAVVAPAPALVGAALAVVLVAFAAANWLDTLPDT
jgi:hypothetical protein